MGINNIDFMGFFRRKQKNKSIRKYLDNFYEDGFTSIELGFMIVAYYGFRIKKIEGQYITFYFADKGALGKEDNDIREYHITMNYEEFVEFVKMTLTIRKKIKVFLIKENRYRTIADELNQLFGNEWKKYSNV